MPDDFEDQDQAESAPFTETETADQVVAPQTEEAPLFSQADNAASSFSFPSSVDQLIAKRQKANNVLLKQAAKLREHGQKNPVYNYNGEMVPFMPPQDAAMWYKPLGGEWEQRNKNVSFVPEQFRMADELEKQAATRQKQIPMLSDGTVLSSKSIWNKSRQMFDNITQGIAETEQLNPQTFLASPVWDSIRQAGADEDTITALQKDLWRSASSQGLIKSFNNSNKWNTSIRALVKDPSTRSFLSDPEILNRLQDPTFKGTSRGYNLLSVIKAKSQAMQDPDIANMFLDLQKSDDPNDKKFLSGLRQTESLPVFNSMISRYFKNVDKIKHTQEQLHNDLEGYMADLKGKQADALKTALGSLIDSRKINNTGELKRKIDALTSVSQEDTVDFFGQKISGMQEVVREKKLVDKIQDNELEPSKLFITPFGKIIPIRDAANLEDEDILHRFGDTKLKAKLPGRYVKIDANKFKDMQGNVVYFQGEGVDPKTNAPIAMPSAIVSGNYQYVLRSQLKNAGITEEQLESEDPIEIGPGKLHFFGKQALPYKPMGMSAEDFMKLPEGQRFVEAKWSLKNADSRFENLRNMSERWTVLQAKPDVPSYIGGAIDGIKQQIARSMLSVPTAIAGTLNSLANLTSVVIHDRITGDKEKAEAYWNAAMGDQENDMADKYLGAFSKSGERAREAQEYLSRDYSWLVGKPISPESTTSYRITRIGGEMVGDLIGMVLSLRLSGLSKASDMISKYATGVTKLQKTIEAMRAAGVVSEGTALMAKLKQLSNLQTVIKMPLEFMGYTALQGETRPLEYAKQAGMGFLGGYVANTGRGFRLPFTKGKGITEELKTTEKIVEGERVQTTRWTDVPVEMRVPWYIDAAKAKAMAAAGTGMYANNVIFKTLEQAYGEGHSSAEAKQSVWKIMSDPSHLQEILPFLLFSSIGQRNYKGIPEYTGTQYPLVKWEPPVTKVYGRVIPRPSLGNRPPPEVPQPAIGGNRMRLLGYKPRQEESMEFGREPNIPGTPGAEGGGEPTRPFREPSEPQGPQPRQGFSFEGGVQEFEHPTETEPARPQTAEDRMEFGGEPRVPGTPGAEGGGEPIRPLREPPPPEPTGETPRQVFSFEGGVEAHADTEGLATRLIAGPETDAEAASIIHNLMDPAGSKNRNDKLPSNIRAQDAEAVANIQNAKPTPEQTKLATKLVKSQKRKKRVQSIEQAEPEEVKPPDQETVEKVAEEAQKDPAGMTKAIIEANQEAINSRELPKPIKTTKAEKAQARINELKERIKQKEANLRKKMTSPLGEVAERIPILADYTALGYEYAKLGYTKFGDWSAKMIADLGNDFKKYAEHVWQAVEARIHKENVDRIVADEPWEPGMKAVTAGQKYQERRWKGYQRTNRHPPKEVRPGVWDVTMQLVGVRVNERTGGSLDTYRVEADSAENAYRKAEMDYFTQTYTQSTTEVVSDINYQATNRQIIPTVSSGLEGVMRNDAMNRLYASFYNVLPHSIDKFLETGEASPTLKNAVAEAWRLQGELIGKENMPKKMPETFAKTMVELVKENRSRERMRDASEGVEVDRMTPEEREIRDERAREDREERLEEELSSTMEQFEGNGCDL